MIIDFLNEKTENIKKHALKYGVNLKGNLKVENLSLDTKAMHETFNTPLEEIHIKAFSTFFFPLIKQEYDIPNNERCRKLAELDILLRKSIKSNSKITFSTNIKSIKSTVEIDPILINDLILLVDSNLNRYSGDIYECEFQWTQINKSDGGKYSDEQIDQILKYENNNKKSHDYYNKRKLSIRLKQSVFYLITEGVFNSDCKTISTSEACFIYDTLVDLEIIERSEFDIVPQEKYQFIKKELKK